MAKNIAEFACGLSGRGFQGIREPMTQTCRTRCGQSYEVPTSRAKVSRAVARSAAKPLTTVEVPRLNSLTNCETPLLIAASFPPEACSNV